jgi:hypothetical protein
MKNTQPKTTTPAAKPAWQTAATRATQSAFDAAHPTTPRAAATPPAPAVAPKLDPMDMMLEFSPEQEQEVRATLLVRLQQQFAGMSTYEIQSVAWYADIEEAASGCDTPAENFITMLVLHQSIRPVTPADAARKLEEFRENFDSMVESARIFVEKYPQALETATAA